MEGLDRRRDVKITRTGGGSTCGGQGLQREAHDRLHRQAGAEREPLLYVVTAIDAAGNVATLKGSATPSTPLLAPREAAHVGVGATLRWRSVPKASYYNVQLWLRGKKVLTTWPAVPRLSLPRLSPGTYTWYVWPGLGPALEHRYGALIGKSTFVVTR